MIENDKALLVAVCAVILYIASFSNDPIIRGIAIAIMWPLSVLGIVLLAYGLSRK